LTDHSPTTDAEILEAMKRSWASDLHFFSNAGKEERERWVVKEFLDHLTIKYSVEELFSHEQKSDVDVQFRDARFQIKEITNPGCRRGAEIKATYQHVMKAKTLEDTIGPSFISDIPNVLNGYEVIRDEALKLAKDPRYVQSKAELDLLFYLTRSRVSIVQSAEIKEEELASLGWRSISCLMGEKALVLFARTDSPEFLRHRDGERFVSY
jgi:hypothetical protein